MKSASAHVMDATVSREVTLIALEPDGQLGPELHLVALDADSYRYFSERLGEEVSLGVVRRRKR